MKFELANDTLETMLNSMYCIRDQFSNLVKLYFCNFPFCFVVVQNANKFPLLLGNLSLDFCFLLTSQGEASNDHLSQDANTL